MIEKKEIDAFWKRFDLMFDTLFSDVELIERQLTKRDLQVWRRALYRAVFAMIEGVNNWLKQSVIEVYWPGIIGDETKNALLDREEYTDQAGRKRIHTRFKKFSDNLFFAFDTYAWTSGSSFAPNKNSPEWNRLHSANAVRNRIVHPKNVSDLQVTNHELALLKTVESWYIDQLFALFRSTARAKLDQLERLAKRRRQHFPDEALLIDAKADELETMRIMLEEEEKEAKMSAS
jgi:hypothetical protein